MTMLTVRGLKSVTIAVWGGIERHEIGLPFAQLSFLQTSSANQAEMGVACGLLGFQREILENGKDR